MMETIYNLAGTTLFIITVAGVFLSATLFMYWLMTTGQKFMISYKETFTESASANMADMFMSVDANRLFQFNLIAIFVLPILTWLLLGDPITTTAIFCLVTFMPAMIYRSMRKRRLRLFEEQLPDALLMMAGSMKAGASLNISLENLIEEQPVPLSQEFELFMREQRIGTDFDVSLQHMEERLPIQDFAMVSSAMRINREIGGNLADIMESLGDTLRRKHQMEGKIESLTAQGKLQGVVMTGLPVLLAFLLYMLEPASMEKLWTTTIGWIVLSIILFMEILGYIMIQKITAIDV